MIDKIWEGEAPYVIAEVSQNHDGSLGQAHAFIDAVADTGADAIKFQMHIAQEESTPFEPFRVPFSYEDKTRFDYWKRMEFSFEQWRGLAEHASNCGLDFLCSPFSIKAFSMLSEIGVSAWKFGAGEIFNKPLVEMAAASGKPLLLSTGLSTYNELDEIVRIIKKSGNPLLLFQCVTAYPSKPESIDLSLLKVFKERYLCEVGISDHSGTIYPSLAAVTLGAKAVEVHVTLSHYMFGPDVKASVTIEELKQIVEGVNFITKMRGAKVDMSARDIEREELKKMFSKGLYATRYIKAGTIVEDDMFAAKKPCLGVDSTNFMFIRGRILKCDLQEGDPLKNEDIE